MSNRTDFDHLANELALQYNFGAGLRDRIALELHNAFVAGQEAAYDEIGVIHGEDAKRLLANLEKPLDPEHVERTRAAAREYLAQVTKPKGSKP